MVRRTARTRSEWLYGRHAVLETLRADRRTVHELNLASGARDQGALADILKLAKKRHIPVVEVKRRDLDQRCHQHQGVSARVSSYPYSDLEQIISARMNSDSNELVLLLDQIQDPHNLGAILRTACATGVKGVILPGKHSVEVTEAVVRTSAGASEHLRIAQSNLVRAMERLKQVGYWVAGLDAGEESMPIYQHEFSGSYALVVGSEGKGMRRLVREKCDVLVRLPQSGTIDSLNASVAAAVTMYLIWEQSGFGIKADQ